MTNEPESTEADERHRQPVEPCHAEAYYMLGVCYADGHGVVRDYAEAIKLFRKAAQRGSARAKFRLDWTFCRRDSVERCYAKEIVWLHAEDAFNWHLQAAREGNR